MDLAFFPTPHALVPCEAEDPTVGVPGLDFENPCFRLLQTLSLFIICTEKEDS